MPIDFEREYGVNAGYVQSIYDTWREDPSAVPQSWGRIFESAGATLATDTSEPASEVEVEVEVDPTLEPLTGLSGRIAANMEASLALPTATSVRTLPAKVLAENRAVINEHMALRALGKASYTHLIAFALARALGEQPRVQASYLEQGEKPFRRVPDQVNLGIAIDVATSRGRTLMVPSIKDAASLDFLGFHAAFEDLVARGRDGKLSAADFKGTSVTLTNPGGFGTTLSVPRLMEGQGLIVATGAIGVPPEVMGMSPEALAQLALGPVMTATSTYDHRVIQGAESGLLLKRLEELLQGADGFYDEVFAALRIPWTPFRAASDLRLPSGRDEAEAQTRVWSLINAYRSRGHCLADLNPLAYEPALEESLDPASYAFTIWDLDRSFLCGGMQGRQRMRLREVLAALRRAYCRRWTVESNHLTNRERKHWLRDQVERPENEYAFDQEHRMQVLTLLSRSENFERFLHTRYVGNKRFSLEGGEALIPALAEVIEHAAEQGVERVVIGMAHRGRLNVLANILHKSYGQIFREFEAVLLPLSTEGSGDVKYHLGQRGVYRTRAGQEVEIELCANPSHLEAVDPVVCGMTRAYQDRLADTDRRRVLAVQVHGDAAFSGQGVVAETLAMGGLPGYTNGGTVHLVVNNQIGFTASPDETRFTRYCTDIAKGVEAPILHANGDYPESVLRACRLAVDYQRRFAGDTVIDIVCYRRWGHNEGDEPAYTQPLLYRRIAAHPTSREHYTRLLQRRGVLTEAEAVEITESFDAELREALEGQRAAPELELSPEEVMDMTLDDPLDYRQGDSPETGVDGERLTSLIDELNTVPEGLVVHPNLLRQLRRREDMVRGERDVDWGCAEALALGSALQDGTPVRISGQDSGRGTFSHRHAVIHDQVHEAVEYVPLADLVGGASFEVHNSLLSEEAVVGFEYGYAVVRPEALVVWEAQFGDFVNGAQIPLDQFVTAGEAKWRQLAGLVLLLPHGYDGQGPEHSSARPERFLSACNAGNLVVANCTTAAQYFHLLRRQAATEQKRPLVVFTPKSLLRDKRAASPVEALAGGRFLELITDGVAERAEVKRVLLCTGKVYYELEAHRVASGVTDTAILRLEQLYPFPKDTLVTELERYGDAATVWVQEEPRNMGAWSFVLQRFLDLNRRIEYAGRPETSSPATGSYKRHAAEQDLVVQRAFGNV